MKTETETLYAELLAQRQRSIGSEPEWWDLLAEPTELQAETESRIPPDRAIALAQQTLKGIGYEPAALGISLVIDQRHGSGRHAYRFPLRVPGDIRVLVRPGAGVRAVELLLHELGHALYTGQIEQEYWEFRAPAAVCFAEAAGQLLARICTTLPWLEATAELPKDLAQRLRLARAEQELIRIRTILLMASFESDARTQDVEALDQMWRDRARSFLHVETAPGVYMWAQIRHFAVAPGHMQCLALAEIAAAQLGQHYTRHLGTLGGSEALGRRLTRDIFRHGARYPWPQLLLKITGRQLGTEPLVRQLQEDLDSGAGDRV